MAIQHFFAGPATVEIKKRNPETGALDAAYTPIGINREAIPVIVTPSVLDVPTDEFGGPEGTPADVQLMGAIANIQLSLTKFEIDELDRLIDGATWNTPSDDTPGAGEPYEYLTKDAGQMPLLGSFLRQNNFHFQLRLHSDFKEMLFEYCFVRNGGAVAQGTRYSSYDLQVEAHMNLTTSSNAARNTLYTLNYPTY
jgi:hypothetical protein|tara:strand:- start:3740 stop:4327 length:588 start_codon:yes stop_codon:yes gene_type:complete